MARHRIFIAINFPPRTKKEFVSYQKKWGDLPIRWTRENNLHLTLVFLGSVDDRDLPEVIERTNKAAENHHPFSIDFNRIFLGPPGRTPRMFWLEGRENQELSDLKADLAGELEALSFKEEKRSFRPHITLGRIKMDSWARLQNKPKIEEKISVILPVNSIEIMESHLKSTGPDYFILESINLGE